jgi:hypothetical protein
LKSIERKRREIWAGAKGTHGMRLTITQTSDDKEEMDGQNTNDVEGGKVKKRNNRRTNRYKEGKFEDWMLKGGDKVGTLVWIEAGCSTHNTNLGSSWLKLWKDELEAKVGRFVVLDEQHMPHDTNLSLSLLQPCKKKLEAKVRRFMHHE